VGKSPEVWGLDQGTILGEIGVKNISPSKPKLGGEKSTRTLPNFKFRETQTDVVIGK
jgi:hypothetical protein